MHGSILVIAKKKAAGPGGYFDPMGEHGGMASGPMMFEMAQDEDTEEGPMGGEGEYDAADAPEGSPSAKLLEIADALEQSSTKHAAQAKSLRGIAAMLGGEEEEEEEEPEEEAPKEKAKKPFPGFGPKKEMKY
jgi:hypothetical protein